MSSIENTTLQNLGENDFGNPELNDLYESLEQETRRPNS